MSRLHTTDQLKRHAEAPPKAASKLVLDYVCNAVYWPIEEKDQSKNKLLVFGLPKSMTQIRKDSDKNESITTQVFTYFEWYV